MLTIADFAPAAAVATAALTLPFELRQKARLKAALDTGEVVGITLPRGKILRGGDKLISQTGLVVQVIAAPESVSTIRIDQPILFATICYHLGNRHVPLEINTDSRSSFCRYAHDHVLDDMVAGILNRYPTNNSGGKISHEQAPFEPESGAYAGTNNSHAHHHHTHA